MASNHNEPEYVRIAGYDIRKPGGWKSKAASGGRYYEKNYEDSQFYLSKVKKSWKNAELECHSLKRHLVTPQSKGAFMKVRARIPPTSNTDAMTWIGFNDRKREGQWKDHSGKRAPDLPWTSRYGNSGRSANCAAMDAMYDTLYDYDCETELRFICGPAKGAAARIAKKARQIKLDKKRKDEAEMERRRQRAIQR